MGIISTTRWRMLSAVGALAVSAAWLAARISRPLTTLVRLCALPDGRETTQQAWRRARLRIATDYCLRAQCDLRTSRVLRRCLRTALTRSRPRDHRFPR